MSRFKTNADKQIATYEESTDASIGSHELNQAFDECINDTTYGSASSQFYSACTVELINDEFLLVQAKKFRNAVWERAQEIANEERDEELENAGRDDEYA